MDNVNLHRVWQETVYRLDILSRRVSEGRDVMAASEFARWIFFSGIIQLCKEHAQDGFLKIDGSLLQWKVEQLIEQCNERFRTNNLDPNFKAEDFRSLHDKLDTMAGYLSRLSVAPAVTIRTSSETIFSGSNSSRKNGQHRTEDDSTVASVRPRGSAEPLDVSEADT
jgi:hypothetical protein